MLSFKMKEEIFEETERITRKVHTPRNAYLNHAVTFYNKIMRRALLKKQLAVESKLVRDNSLEVLETFEALEDEIEGS